MSTFFNKTVLVMLLCLIFIGQSMASSTMFYKMTAMSTMGKMSHTSNMKMNSMNHFSSDATHVNSESTSTACCKQECKCSASGCSVPSAFSTSHTSAILESATKILSHTAILPEQALSSLYRPPILS